MKLALAACLMLAATPAVAANWNVDTGKSRLGFSLAWGKEPYAAHFKSWKADITFDPADLVHAHVLVSIDTGSSSSGDADTDEGVAGASGFETGKFPVAKFESKSIAPAGKGFVADGILTVRGISRPLRLPFSLAIAGASAHMTGSAQTKWADFGMGKDMGAEMPDIGPLVTIKVDLTASKAIQPHS